MRILLFFLVTLSVFIPAPVLGEGRETGLWSIQSIDTVKYSRDASRAYRADPATAEATIHRQLQLVAETGATHVAIGTPYDEEFLPVLIQWVSAARRHGLSVWFRGNWAGWEQWFGYPPIDRAEHLRATEAFITNHSELFADGDIFDACPECENGGPGDPRRTGDIAGHRQFLLDEYRATTHAFARIGKNVRTNIHSMNGDVARLLMDRPTTRALGGIVAIDHYVTTPEELVRDIQALRAYSGGEIILGEFGVPIPNIHGSLSDAAQAAWIQSALKHLAAVDGIVGINYWSQSGSSTHLWRDDETPRPSVGVIRSFFTPVRISGVVRTTAGAPLPDARIEGSLRDVTTDENGVFSLSIPPGSFPSTFHIAAPGYAEETITIRSPHEQVDVRLLATNASVFQWLGHAVRRVWSFFSARS